jgi:oligo-1,6-glucosidase
MQTTLGGTLFVYQGEEIGIRNVPVTWGIEEFKDIETINFWKKCQELHGNDKELLDHGRTIVDMKARDHARTPMQWTSGDNAGFCDPGVKPWMRIVDDYDQINVEAQMRATEDNDLSVWQFWQRALRDRKEHADALVYGDFQELNHEHPQVYAYTRTSVKGRKWLVILNFSGRTVEWTLPGGLEVKSWPRGNCAKGVITKPRSGMIPLKPWEGILGECT